MYQISSDDEYYMRVALAQARGGLGRTSPNPAVGCVIVRGGVILAAARTADGGRPHAETQALKQAGGLARGGDVYVTLEPCAHHGQTGPCAEALARAGVRRVFVACGDPDPRVAGRGLDILREAGVEVVSGVLEREARDLNRGFFLKVQQQRPFVAIKMAVSADGMIASAPGRRTQISGARAGLYTHFLRSHYDSILVGVNTVLVDNPFLTCRLPGHNHVMRRVVLDGHLKIQGDSNMVQGVSNDPLLIFHSDAPVDKIVELSGMGCELIARDPRDLSGVLAELAAHGCTRLLVEGGAEIWAAFLEAGCVDEFHVIRSPQILGPGGVSAPGGADASFFEARYGFIQQKSRALGEDLLEIYSRAD